MLAPMNGGGATEQACVRCATRVSQATSYLTEVGLLCWACFGKFQSQQQVAQRDDADLQRSLTRRAQSLAGVHWVMWAGIMIVATGHGFADWGRSVLLVAVGGLGIGLFLRLRWAYRTALVLDTAGAVALVALAAVQRHPIILAAEIFPAALLVLTWTLRSAYAEAPPLAGMIAAPGATPPVAARRPGRVALAAVLIVAASGGTTAILLRRHRPPADPALTLLQSTLPRWQLARADRSGRATGPSGGDLVGGARRWPALAAAFENLDRSWPEEAPVRAAAASANRALADAGLPYLVSVWMVYDRPYVLSHELVARGAWQIGARSIDVLRLRRLDNIGIDFAFDGVTQSGLPVVMLDRVEATLAREIPAMYAAAREPRASDLNDFDRAALARARSFMEATLGPPFARAALALRERDRLLEEMRTRFHGDEIKLAVPEQFVLGDAWLEDLKPSARLDRPGGPLFLDTDLKALVKADEGLRDPATTEAFRGAVESVSLTIEAHEARHAAEASEPAAPPPPALFEVMPDSSTRMVGWADSELQAFLGELHDAPTPACVNLAKMMRTVYGRWARREPHFYATLALLKQLGADEDQDPAQQLAALCAVPDADVRNRVPAIWRRLYGAPMAVGERTVQLTSSGRRSPAGAPSGAEGSPRTPH